MKINVEMNDNKDMAMKMIESEINDLKKDYEAMQDYINDKRLPKDVREYEKGKLYGAMENMLNMKNKIINNKYEFLNK